jgi:uncharacterized phage protein gp47/JayE
MPLDVLPAKIVVFQRNEIRDQYLRDYSIRNPTGSTAEGQQPFIDASTLADTLTPVYANAVAIGNGIAIQTMNTAQLANEAARLGTAPLAAAGASGFVIAQGSTGGGTIFVGDEIKSATGLRYLCTATGVYPPGAYVPIAGLDTGPTTNQTAGTVMAWSSPRPGISSSAIVATQSNGNGLFGGRNLETDAQLIARLIALRANPPASGNDAAYQAAITAAPGLSIQQPFTYPAIVGPGSIGFTFTLLPALPGAGRIPSAAQLESVRSWIVGQFPKDDGIYACALVAQPITVILQPTWAPTAPGWTDSTTWPPTNVANPVTVAISTSALACRLSTGVNTTGPQVGQTIGFYDAPNATFRRKRILTVSAFVAGRAWDVTFDTTNAASDASYIPVVGQTPSPWSDSLQSLAPSVVAYFDGLGPGEQVSSFFDAGYRRRRSPRAPALWPNSITNRVLQTLFALSTVADINMLSPTIPFTTTVGSPGVSANLLTLGDLAAFP